MTEWSVVLVIISLVGLFATVGKPVINLNRTMTENTQEVKHLKESMATFRSESHDTHEQQWAQIRQNTEELVNHEARINTLEKTREDKK